MHCVSIFTRLKVLAVQLVKQHHHLRQDLPLLTVKNSHLTYFHVESPRIAKSLKEFQESWNNHPLSTEGNLTPYQLFFEGTNIMLNDGDTDIDLTSPSVNTPTVNPTTFDPECLSSEHVAVPRILFLHVQC